MIPAHSSDVPPDEPMDELRPYAQLFNTLAQVARKHDVMIHITISPYDSVVTASDVPEVDDTR